MTKNETRSRVQAGVPTGGQFATEIHQEAAGATLTSAPSLLDEAALATVGSLVRSRASVEVGKWQRRHDYARLKGEDTKPLPPVLVELNRQAKDFESLAVDEQRAVLEQLNYGAANHLLEPGQTLGNDRVRIADDVDPGDDHIANALVRQKVMADAGLPGTITMTRAGDFTDFAIQDGHLEHTVKVGRTMAYFSTEPAKDDPYARGTWLYRADVPVFCGNLLEEDRSADMRKYYDDHHEKAVLMDVMASSSFKDCPSEFGDLDREKRTAVLKADDSELLLDVSGKSPVLRAEEGQPALHPAAARGFLDHMAQLTGHQDGETFAADLREAFRETDRRLVR
jgi:hypothetical protein